MNRRAAIMSALLAIAAKMTEGQQSEMSTNTRITRTLVMLEVKDMDVDAFVINYKGRTVRVSMTEVMDALGAHEIKEKH